MADSLPTHSEVKPGVRVVDRGGTGGTVVSEVNEFGNVLVEWDDGLRMWPQARLLRLEATDG